MAVRIPSRVSGRELTQLVGVGWHFSEALRVLTGATRRAVVSNHYQHLITTRMLILLCALKVLIGLLMHCQLVQAAKTNAMV